MNNLTNQSKIKVPKVGDKLYVYGSMSISNGSSDTAGGLATIKKINKSKHLSEDHINYYMVEFEELPGHGYNLRNLLNQQEELAMEYKDQVAHPDPDIDTPWIESGDTVNGNPYSGPDIW